ncbi:hypothetical protein K9K77_01850 [Candidatus Babeliales bacterium]|nr:hypothetical protein [Candidatus Babeliales bacterium]
MKKQFFALSLIATSLLVLPGCWKSAEEKTVKNKTEVVAKAVTKKASKELVDNETDFDKELDKELI